MSDRYEAEEWDMESPPPFNVKASYSHFNENAVPDGHWKLGDSISARFKELNLPLELLPHTVKELSTGSMMFVWHIDNKDQLGFALHKLVQPDEDVF